MVFVICCLLSLTRCCNAIDQRSNPSLVQILMSSSVLFLINFRLVGMPYPSLPTSRRVRKWIDAAMKDLGLKDGARGSWLSVDLAIEELMRHVGTSPVDGKLHVQVMADAVRVFRKTAFTTVALRALQGTQDYNSMATMNIL